MLRWLVLLVSVVWATSALTQEMWPPLYPQIEVTVEPSFPNCGAPCGFDLVYRNLITVPGDPDEGSVETEAGLIAWKLNHTPNSGVDPRDSLTVTVVPDGYFAIPETLYLQEGEVGVIKILPEGLS